MPRNNSGCSIEIKEMFQHILSTKQHEILTRETLNYLNNISTFVTNQLYKVCSVMCLRMCSK